MSTTSLHAWFSAETALRHGSSCYRKPDGSTVNVTRMDADRDSTRGQPQDERYVGEVVSPEGGGCVRGNWRVPSINR
jgi:hypothetical protein